jgi:hypothetical protein
MSYKLHGKARGGARPPASAPTALPSQPTGAGLPQAHAAPASGNRDEAILAQCCFKGAVDVLCEKIRTVCDQNFTDKVGAAEVLALTAELFDGMKDIVAGKRFEPKQAKAMPQQDDTPF